PPQPLGFAHHVADLLDAGEHGAERDEARFGRVGDDPRQRRLARAGRAPEDDRLQQIALDRLAQRLAVRQQGLLTHELVERARPHAFGEGRRRALRRARFLVLWKETVHIRCLCRRASYRTSAAVTAAFSDSTGALIGIVTRSSAASTSDCGSPGPSPPI